MPAKKGKKEVAKPEEVEHVEEAAGEPEMKKGKAAKKAPPAKGKAKKVEEDHASDENDQEDDDSADAMTPEPEETEEKPKKTSRVKKDAAKNKTKAELKEDVSNLEPRTLRTRKNKPVSYDEEEPIVKKSKGAKKNKAKGIYTLASSLARLNS